MRGRLSPLEATVLQLLGEQWHTRTELQRRLFPGQPPDSVRGAMTYLRERELIVELPRQHGESYWETTELGRQVLADDRAAIAPLYVEGARAW